MYYPDLWVRPDVPASVPLPILTVGWLDARHDFPTGQPDPAFAERLAVFCAEPLWVAMGMHECEFCAQSATSRARGDRRERLGSGIIVIFGQDGIYESPELILHYVNIHQYAPPEQFIRALMDCPLPDSPEYEQLVTDSGLA